MEYIFQREEEPAIKLPRSDAILTPFRYPVPFKNRLNIGESSRTNDDKFSSEDRSSSFPSPSSFDTTSYYPPYPFPSKTTSSVLVLTALLYSRDPCIPNFPVRTLSLLYITLPSGSRNSRPTERRRKSEKHQEKLIGMDIDVYIWTQILYG